MGGRGRAVKAGLAPRRGHARPPRRPNGAPRRTVPPTHPHRPGGRREAAGRLHAIKDCTKAALRAAGAAEAALRGSV